MIRIDVETIKTTNPKLVDRVFSYLVVSVLAVMTTSAATEASSLEFDLVLSNGIIVDGTGGDRFKGDIGITKGRIVQIGQFEVPASSRLLDIEGLVVAPGFIDVHNHADRALSDPATAGLQGYLRQGVTTSVYGVDGALNLEGLKRYVEMAEAGVMGLNFMSYIGHNGIRESVMGNVNRPPTDPELAAMRSQVKQAMELGAVGLSTGLMYLPGKFATTEEVTELAKVLEPFGGIYESHVRDPVNLLLESHQECLDIALAAGVVAHPAHIKAVGAKNFGKGPDLVRLVETGIARGQSVTVDLYPYDGALALPVLALLYPGNDKHGRELMQQLVSMNRGKTSRAGIPALESEIMAYWNDVGEGTAFYRQAVKNTENPDEETYSWIDVVGYQSMRIVVSEQPGFEGRMVTELASELGVSPFELFRRIILAEGVNAMVTLGAILEEDIRVLLKQPWAMVSSDGLEANPNHPRGRGTFPRVLGRYVRELGVLELEKAVYKMTGLPANFLNMADRGVIRVGAIADLVVFNPDTITDNATWSEPGLYAQGVSFVLIGGEFALKDGVPTPQRLGQFIRFSKN